MDMLDGKDAYPVFAQASACARGDNLTQYDKDINALWQYAVDFYISGEYSREEAINWFKAMVLENVPSIMVDGVMSTVTPEDPFAQKPTEPEPNDEKTTIEVMAYTSEVPKMIRKYVETHPEFEQKYDVKFTIVSTDHSAYNLFLADTLSGENGQTAPHLFVAEASFVKTYTSGNASQYACTYEELGIDVEQRIRDAEITAYTADIGRGDDGKIVALSYDGDGCAFIYNSEVAKDVFGDDSPETVEAALGHDWDTFFAAAEKCKQKGYAIVSGDGDIWRAVANSADQGWVVDGQLYIDPKRAAFMDYSKRLKDNDYHNDTKDWMEAWYADMAEVGPKKVLGFYGAMWFLNYTLLDHCGYMLSDDGSTVENLGTYGQWRVCKPNFGSFYGGNWLLANKEVLEDEDLKAGVRELIEYITLDTSETGLQYEWAHGTFDDEYYDPSDVQDNVASLKIMRATSAKMDILGGQDAFPALVAAAEMVRTDNLTQYDEVIDYIWRDAVRAYTSGELTKEESIRWFKQAVGERIPEISVK